MATYDYQDARDSALPATRQKNGRGAFPRRLGGLVLVVGLALLISEQTRASGVVLVAVGGLWLLSTRTPKPQSGFDQRRVLLATGETVNVEVERP